MAKDLFSMKRGKNAGKTGDGGANTEQKVKQVFEKYQGKSEKEIEKDLMDAVKKQTESGKFDPESLERFYSTAQVMLTGEQRTRMRQIIDMIKQQKTD